MGQITQLRHWARWYQIVSVETHRCPWPNDHVQYTEILARRGRRTIRRTLEGAAVAKHYAVAE